MKNKFKYILIISSFIFLLGTSIHIANAATQTYVPLEPAAFVGIDTTTATDSFGHFLAQVFDYGIAACVALSALMIIWGGIELMTTDSWSKTEAGKEKITNALEGLGIALISYLLLFTINPALVDFTNNTLLQKPPTPVSYNAPIEGYTAPVAGVPGVNGGVGCPTDPNLWCKPCPTCTVNVTAICKNSGGYGCNLPVSLADKIKNVFAQAKAAGFNPVITEAWPPTRNHSAPNDPHATGQAADINIYKQAGVYGADNADTDVKDIATMQTIITRNGLQFLYERKDETTCAPYKAAGLECYPDGADSHFHVHL